MKTANIIGTVFCELCLFQIKKLEDNVSRKKGRQWLYYPLLTLLSLCPQSFVFYVTAYSLFMLT